MRSPDDGAPRRRGTTRGQVPSAETGYRNVRRTVRQPPGPCSHFPPAPGHACEVCGHVRPRAVDYVAIDPVTGDEFRFETVRWIEVAA
jgi:hypothetical protein